MVDDVDVEDDFGVEKEDKSDERDRDIGKGIGNYRNASEKVCGCTLARYRIH